MKITETIVQSIQERAYCECGGELKATGYALASNPPQFGHRCDACGRSVMLFDAQYPRIVHKPIEPPATP